MSKEKILDYYYIDHAQNNNIFNFFCVHNASFHLLNYLKVKNPVLLLDCSLKFEVLIDSSNNLYPFITRINNDPIIDNDITQLHYADFGLEYDEILKSNRIAIENGKPIILGVDQFYLPYHSEYMKTHGAHAVVLCGYKEVAGHIWYYIVDHYRQHNIREKIASEEMHKARSSKNSWNGNINTGGSILYASLELKQNRNKDGEIKYVYETLAKTIEGYFNRYENSDIIYGIEGLEHIFIYLKQMLNNYDANQNKTILFMDIYAGFLPICAKKQLFEVYMLEAARLYKNKTFILISEQMKEINNSWSVFLKVLLKIAHSSALLSRLFSDLIDIYEKCLTQEKKLFKLLKN